MAARILPTALAALALAGCSDHLARRDTVSAFAGDSQAQAIAAQAVNPWPSRAYEKTWRSSPRWIAASEAAAAAKPPILPPTATTDATE